VSGKARAPFLDVVRSGAILAVIGERWLMPVLNYSGGRLAAGTALSPRRFVPP
jgi:hypothetical protein